MNLFNSISEIYSSLIQTYLQWLVTPTLDITPVTHSVLILSLLWVISLFFWFVSKAFQVSGSSSISSIFNLLKQAYSPGTVELLPYGAQPRHPCLHICR